MYISATYGPGDVDEEAGAGYLAPGPSFSIGGDNKNNSSSGGAQRQGGRPLPPGLSNLINNVTVEAAASTAASPPPQSMGSKPTSPAAHSASNVNSEQKSSSSVAVDVDADVASPLANNNVTRADPQALAAFTLPPPPGSQSTEGQAGVGSLGGTPIGMQDVPLNEYSSDDDIYDDL